MQHTNRRPTTPTISAPLGEPDNCGDNCRRGAWGDAAALPAQRLGFTLDEIGELLRLDDGTHCDDARRLAEGKPKDVREKLADLRQMQTALSALVKACQTRQGELSCLLIASLQK